MSAAVGSAGLGDGVAHGGVGRPGELVLAVGVEGRGDQLGVLEGEFEQFALDAVVRAAQVQAGAARGVGGGGLHRPGGLARGARQVGLRAAALLAFPVPAGELGDAVDDELVVGD